MIRFSSTEIEKIETILVNHQLDRLIEIKNPLGINSSTNDENSIVVVVVVYHNSFSLAIRTLVECETRRYNCKNTSNIAVMIFKWRVEFDKQIAGVVRRWICVLRKLFFWDIYNKKENITADEILRYIDAKNLAF